MKTDILRDLISFNTIEDKDNILIMDYCINFLKEYDFSIKEIIKDNKKAIIATRGDAKIGFLGHTDVVKVNDDWLTNSGMIHHDDEENVNNYVLGILNRAQESGQISFEKVNK